MAPPHDVPPGPAQRLTDWNLLRSFIAIYETATLTGAGQRLGITQPSMGRHLRELERVFGETLFTRLPGRLEPTGRAHALYAAVAGMRTAARDVERLFAEHGERPLGTVRVAAGEAYAYHVLPAILGPLLNAEPGLEIELSVSNTADNLLRREADIAVRFFAPAQDGLIARQVGTTELGLFVHERFIERFGDPVDEAMAPEVVMAGLDRLPMDIAAAVHGTPMPRPPRMRWRSDFVLANHALVEGGGAVAMMFVDIAARRPALRRVLAERVRLPQPVWLCAHDELRRSSRMRCVWDCLVDGLQAHLADGPQAQLVPSGPAGATG